MCGHRGAVLIIAGHFGAAAQLDQTVFATGLQEHPMQITTMHHRIGIAEPLAEGFTQIDMGDFFGRERVHQPELIDIDRHGARGFADAEIVKGVKRVRPELDARADFAERGGLYKQHRGNALLRQPERGGETADAAAGDQDRPPLQPRHQFDFPKCSSASSARNGTRDASLLRSTSCVNSASSSLRSAGFSGCNIRACARSTAGMTSRSSAAPDLVRYSSFVRLSSNDGLRSTYCFASNRSITLPSVERSNAMTAESRVASMPG